LRPGRRCSRSRRGRRRSGRGIIPGIVIEIGVAVEFNAQNIPAIQAQDAAAEKPPDLLELHNSVLYRNQTALDFATVAKHESVGA
jgi:hypothetical protein